MTSERKKLGNRGILLLLLFLGLLIFECVRMVAINQRVSKISETIGDVIIKESYYTAKDLAVFSQIAKDEMLPFRNSVNVSLANFMIRNNELVVLWEYATDTSKSAAPSSIDQIPEKYRKNTNALFAVSVNTIYAPIIGLFPLHADSVLFSFFGVELSGRTVLKLG